MNLSLAQLSDGLLSVSDVAFYDAFAQVRQGAKYDLNALEQLVGSLAELAIPEMRKAHRLRTILQRLGVSRETLLHLARTTAARSATLRNEFATLLPAADRRAIYESGRATSEAND